MAAFAAMTSVGITASHGADPATRQFNGDQNVNFYFNAGMALFGGFCFLVAWFPYKKPIATKEKQVGWVSALCA